MLTFELCMHVCIDIAITWCMLYISYVYIYIRIAAEAVVRIFVLPNYLFNVCYLRVGVIWAVLYMIL